MPGKRWPRAMEEYRLWAGWLSYGPRILERIYPSLVTQRVVRVGVEERKRGLLGFLRCNRFFPDASTARLFLLHSAPFAEPEAILFSRWQRDGGLEHFPIVQFVVVVKDLAVDEFLLADPVQKIFVFQQ